MTRNDILRATQLNFEEMFGVWNRNMDLREMGVLVIISRVDVMPENGIDFQYLTLRELREFRSKYTDNHGFVYRWVKQSKSVRGIPVVILSPASPVNRKRSFAGFRTS